MMVAEVQVMSQQTVPDSFAAGLRDRHMPPYMRHGHWNNGMGPRPPYPTDSAAGSDPAVGPGAAGRRDHDMPPHMRDPRFWNPAMGPYPNDADGPAGRRDYNNMPPHMRDPSFWNPAMGPRPPFPVDATAAAGPADASAADVPAGAAAAAAAAGPNGAAASAGPDGAAAPFDPRRPPTDPREWREWAMRRGRNGGPDAAGAPDNRRGPWDPRGMPWAGPYDFRHDAATGPDGVKADGPAGRLPPHLEAMERQRQEWMSRHGPDGRGGPGGPGGEWRGPAGEWPQDPRMRGGWDPAMMPNGERRRRRRRGMGWAAGRLVGAGVGTGGNSAVGRGLR
jgi:hypothetical protein